ncbi:oxidoreductase, short chain dehydrogenase/reductase family protein [Flavobacteriaceae bacterium 3519-10]|nr:oxidoreductase, short chain dehydrogenase/reductase family protein [Flavobacteriaceae bacterium 3519-10]
MTGAKHLEGQWALILGGSSGLGLATAKKLAAEGMNICIIHRDSRQAMAEIQQDFDKIRKKGNPFLSFNVDASNSEKIGSVVNDIRAEVGQGSVYCIVHSIAKGNLKSMVDSQEGELQKNDFLITVDAMSVSLYEWVKSVFSAGLFAKDARVLSFTSMGNSRAYRGYAAVSAAKAALEAITRNIALEFAPYGIRANCIQAGLTDTKSQRMIPGAAEMKEQSIRRNPFKRITTPEDVADAVYLLCQPEAAWITGAVIPVDGGESII